MPDSDFHSMFTISWRSRGHVFCGLVFLVFGALVQGAVYELAGVTEPGSAYRWLDVAGNVYTSSFREAYTYAQAQVTVDLSSHGQVLHGTLTATGLKPNFAYQIKLRGDPGTATNERLGLAGRWWQEMWDGGAWTGGWNLNNKGVGTFPNPNDQDYFSRRDVSSDTSPTEKLYRFSAYIVLAYFVTDSQGAAALSFSGGSSYHVLWTTDQRPWEPEDGPLITVPVIPSDSHPAYAMDGQAQTVSVFGEWERLPVGGVFLSEGDYDCRLLLSEESFHGMGGTYSGFWAPALDRAVAFRIDRTAPTVQVHWDSPWGVSLLFSEEVYGADSASSYVLLPNGTVGDVLSVGTNDFRLFTGAQVPGIAYSLSLTDITDAAGNPTAGHLSVPAGRFATASSPGDEGDVYLYLGLSPRATGGVDSGLDVLSDGTGPLELISPQGGDGVTLVSDFRRDTDAATRWRVHVLGAETLGERFDVVWQAGGVDTGAGAVLQRLEHETAVGGAIDLVSTSGIQLSFSAGECYEVAMGILQVTSVQLSPGWNLVGIPLMASETVGELMSRGDREAGAGVWAWSWGGVHYEAVGADDWLNPERGYWLWSGSQEEVTLEVRGIPADGIFSLRTGWNLVSPPASISAEELSAEISDVWGWSGSGKRYERVTLEALLTPGGGYWVYLPESP